MPVTAAQVQDIQTTIKDELEARTFTLYGTTPNIKKDVQKISGKNTFITLNTMTGEIIYAMNNSPIYFDDTCELIIYTRNRTNLNKIYADVINIFSASDKNIIIKNPRDLSQSDKYIKLMTIKLLNI